MTGSTPAGAPASFITLLLAALAIIAIITFLWALPAWLRRSSFRPGEPWGSDPLWMGAPDGVDSARVLTSAPSTAALTSGSTASLTPDQSGDDRGGASARW